jgi:hypothetical protein
MYNILPLTIFGLVYDRIEISPITVALDQSASWTARIFSVDGDPAQAIVRNLSIAEEKYNSWGNDDKFILEETASVLGVTIAE